MHENPENIGADQNIGANKNIQVQTIEASSYCFGLAKSTTVTHFSPILGGILLLKMLSPPHVEAK
jgi:hypothetical protein